VAECGGVRAGPADRSAEVLKVERRQRRGHSRPVFHQPANHLVGDLVDVL
jgi:hypothetical protein